jgi:hypothetical protein
VDTDPIALDGFLGNVRADGHVVTDLASDQFLVVTNTAPQ